MATRGPGHVGVVLINVDVVVGGRKVVVVSSLERSLYLIGIKPPSESAAGVMSDDVTALFAIGAETGHMYRH